MSKYFQSARQYVLTTLRTEILKGRYPENTHLRQEEVARRLNVSTTPVREAFRDLRAEGLVSIDANKGVVTRSLTIADVTEIYELRITLEPMLARRACLHMTEEHLAAATHCHETMSATDSPEQWSMVNEAFHDHFVASQARTRLFEMVASLSRVARPYVALSMHVDREIMESNNREHAALLAAYRDGDASAVQAQTRSHLENTRDALVACVDQWAAPRAAG
ncbi:GntR family transcriptional regulator [Robbsia sp. Bb-Pol-6]|uniref:GntR family transcriptional regulator n=1 Tax=Robbsia betulipollinis TaxID=2981849 RepID=A0ABT3ZUC6_9BURK|nr:GntR family transcriptional regulator [Robbsia betulipollinis]MCY0389820.1 GntR family transcriptional regulator [Robbsia betulipollinis]